MDATAYYAIGIPLYIVLFGGESLLARARGLPTPTFAGSVSNITTGLGAIVVGMVVGPLLVALYDWAHTTFGLVEWSSWWTPFFLALVLGDLANYWRHRLEHRSSILWAVHNVHHTPTEMNLTVGMRHAWLSDTYAFPFYAALPLIIPTAQFFLVMVTLTLYALLTHSRAYSFPSFGILVTPQSHALHHARNAQYVNRNFSAMFTVWDRLFGTYAAPDPADPPVFGLADHSGTYDGALAQWVGWRALWNVDVNANVNVNVNVNVNESATAKLSPHARLYVLFQLAVLIFFSAYVFGLHGWAAFCGGSLVILAIIGIGGILDHRPTARLFETLRLAIFIPAGIALVGATW